MKENSYEQIDDLFAQIGLRLGRVRQTDPATAEEIKGLLRQLEDCVESLVVDSLKLRSMEASHSGQQDRKRDVAKGKASNRRLAE